MKPPAINSTMGIPLLHLLLLVVPFAVQAPPPGEDVAELVNRLRSDPKLLSQVWDQLNDNPKPAVAPEVPSNQMHYYQSQNPQSGWMAKPPADWRYAVPSGFYQQSHAPAPAAYQASYVPPGHFGLQQFHAPAPAPYQAHYGPLGGFLPQTHYPDLPTQGYTGVPRAPFSQAQDQAAELGSDTDSVHSSQAASNPEAPASTPSQSSNDNVAMQGPRSVQGNYHYGGARPGHFTSAYYPEGDPYAAYRAYAYDGYHQAPVPVYGSNHAAYVPGGAMDPMYRPSRPFLGGSAPVEWAGRSSLTRFAGLPAAKQMDLTPIQSYLSTGREMVAQESQIIDKIKAIYTNSEQGKGKTTGPTDAGAVLVAYKDLRETLSTFPGLGFLRDWKPYPGAFYKYPEMAEANRLYREARGIHSKLKQIVTIGQSSKAKFSLITNTAKELHQKVLGLKNELEQRRQHFRNEMNGPLLDVQTREIGLNVLEKNFFEIMRRERSNADVKLREWLLDLESKQSALQQSIAKLAEDSSDRPSKSKAKAKSIETVKEDLRKLSEDPARSSSAGKAVEPEFGLPWRFQDSPTAARSIIETLKTLGSDKMVDYSVVQDAKGKVNEQLLEAAAQADSHSGIPWEEALRGPGLWHLRQVIEESQALDRLWLEKVSGNWKSIINTAALRLTTAEAKLKEAQTYVDKLLADNVSIWEAYAYPEIWWLGLEEFARSNPNLDIWKSGLDNFFHDYAAILGPSDLETIAQAHANVAAELFGVAFKAELVLLQQRHRFERQKQRMPWTAAAGAFKQLAWPVPSLPSRMPRQARRIAYQPVERIKLREQDDLHRRLSKTERESRDGPGTMAHGSQGAQTLKPTYEATQEAERMPRDHADWVDASRQEPQSPPQRPGEARTSGDQDETGEFVLHPLTPLSFQPHSPLNWLQGEEFNSLFDSDSDSEAARQDLTPPDSPIVDQLTPPPDLESRPQRVQLHSQRKMGRGAEDASNPAQEDTRLPLMVQYKNLYGWDQQEKQQLSSNSFSEIAAFPRSRERSGALPRSASTRHGGSGSYMDGAAYPAQYQGSLGSGSARGDPEDYSVTASDFGNTSLGGHRRRGSSR